MWNPGSWLKPVSQRSRCGFAQNLQFAWFKNFRQICVSVEWRYAINSGLFSSRDGSFFSFRKIFSISSSRHVMWLCCQHEKGLFVTILRKIALSNRPSVTETQLLIRFGKQHTPKVVYSLFHLLFVSLLHTYCTYRHLDVILLVISYKSLVNIIPFIWRSAVLGQELDTFFKDPFGCNLFQKSGHFSGGRLNQNGTPKPSRVPGFASVRHGDASDVFKHWGRWRHV